jgi:hypothetical protein
MKLKKSFTFTDKNQIWRLLISKSDKLIIETRNTESKEAYFHCYDFISEKKIFNNIQFTEKYWIGIEAVENNIICFHHFAKPNMPEHKGIVAFDINNQKVLWQNNDLIFLTFFEHKVYALKRKFEGQDVYVLDSKNGAVIAELGNDLNKLNEILQKAQLNEDYSDYKYPEQFHQNGNHKIVEIINQEIHKKNITQNIDILFYGEFLLFNYYLINKNNLLDNVFTVYNIDKRKKVSSEVINENLNAVSPDSFFCYKNFLIVLKNKNEILVQKFI